MSETTETDKALLTLIKPFFWPILATIGFGSSGFMAGQNQTGADTASLQKEMSELQKEVVALGKEAALRDKTITELEQVTKARAGLTACGARQLDQINNKLGLKQPCDLSNMANIGL